MHFPNSGLVSVCLERAFGFVFAPVLLSSLVESQVLEIQSPVSGRAGVCDFAGLFRAGVVELRGGTRQTVQ